MQNSLRLSVICLNASVLLLVVLVSAGCEDRTFASRMRGHSLSTVVDELGQPQTTYSFPVGPPFLYEYRGGLLHHLSQAELAAHVVVKEVCWPGLLSTHYVWFIERDKQWVAVNALDWPRGRRY